MSTTTEAELFIIVLVRLWLWSVLAISAASGAWMVWRREPFAFPLRPSRSPWPQRGVQSAIAQLGLLIGVDALRGVCGLPHWSPLPLAWVSWRGLTAATVMCVRGSSAAAALYAVAAIGVGVAWIERRYAPGIFFVWGALCDLAGFALVAALVGWAVPRLLARWHRRQRSASERGYWFCIAQAAWIACTAGLAAWIALDFRFDCVGQQVALFGLAGRTAGAAAALMLLGATMLMAWQTPAAGRGAWQYAALAAGVLWTSSLGWSQVDAAALVSSGTSAWLKRSEILLISAGMMTLMTGWGLARILPAGSDWLERARRAMPLFASLALLILVLVLVQRSSVLEFTL